MQELNSQGHLTKEGMLIFLDFEKAFDRVDHEFMFNVMETMGFGPTIINWFKLLYNINAKSAVRINNKNSNVSFFKTSVPPRKAKGIDPIKNGNNNFKLLFPARI